MADSSRVQAGVPRRVQVSVWFPSDSAVRERPLRFGDYVGLGSTETEGEDSPAARARGAAKFQSFLVRNGVPASAAESLFASPMMAREQQIVRGPSRAMVLVAQGNGQSAYSQAVLGEYLASLGLVVASTPSPMRTGSTLAVDGDVFVAARQQALDLEAAAKLLSSRGAADPSRVALVGHSFGARAGLLLLDSRLTAFLISLDGGIGLAGGGGWLREADLAASGVTGTVIHIYETSDSTVKPDLSLLRQMESSRRELVFVPGLAHWQFTSFGTIGRAFPAVAPGVAAPESAERSGAVMKYVGCRLVNWSQARSDSCAAPGGAFGKTDLWLPISPGQGR